MATPPRFDFTGDEYDYVKETGFEILKFQERNLNKFLHESNIRK